MDIRDGKRSPEPSATDVDVTIQSLASNMATSYCDPCERHFNDRQALQMHIKDSKVHKQNAKKQIVFTQAKQVESAIAPNLGTAALGMNSHGQLAYVVDTFPTLVYGASASLIGASLYSTTSPWNIGTTVFYGGAGNVPIQTPSAETNITTTYCEICQREFPHEGALQMHVNNSKVHQKELRKRGALLQAELKTASSARLREEQGFIESSLPILTYNGSGPVGTETSAKYGQTGDAISFPIQNATGLRHGVQDNGTSPISMSTNLQQLPTIGITQNATNGHGGSLHYRYDRWSVIPATQWPAALELLSKHCHSLEDLLKNRYILRPYSSEDITCLRRCRNCGSRF